MLKRLVETNARRPTEGVHCKTNQPFLRCNCWTRHHMGLGIFYFCPQDNLISLYLKYIHIFIGLKIFSRILFVVLDLDYINN